MHQPATTVLVPLVFLIRATDLEEPISLLVSVMKSLVVKALFHTRMAMIVCSQMAAHLAKAYFLQVLQFRLTPFSLASKFELKGAGSVGGDDTKGDKINDEY